MTLIKKANTSQYSINYAVISIQQLLIFHTFKMKVLIATALLFLIASSQSTSSTCLLAIAGTSQCQVCQPGLQLDNLGSCKLYTPIEGCIVYNSNSSSTSAQSLCFQCDAGRLLFGGTCPLLPSNCLSSDSLNYCQVCNSGFVLVGQSNCYSTNTTNCPLGSLPLNSSSLNFCQVYNILNCISRSGNSFCLECTSGFQLLNGICFASQSKVPCPNNSCNCQYTLFANTCYQITLPACLSPQYGIYCDICNNNFYLLNGYCYTPVKSDDFNCNVVLPNGRCSGCNFNYYLNANFICVKNFGLCPNQTCTTCSDLKNFDFYQGNCYFKDPLCTAYNFTTQTCIQCFDGYSLNPNTLICQKTFTCLSQSSNGFCSICFSGYQLNPNTLQCDQLPSNCLKINSQNQQCITCNSLTTLNNGNCIFSSPNCLGYSNFGICNNCNDALNVYTLVSGSCKLAAKNCNVTTLYDASTCNQCNIGYRLSSLDSLCYLNQVGCLVYGAGNACAQCNTNYLLQAGTCFYIDQNCQAVNSQGSCVNCALGFLPFQNKCVYYHPYCASYSDTGSCLVALAPFGLSAFSNGQKLAYNSFILSSASGSSSSSASTGGSFSSVGEIISLPYAGLLSQSVVSNSFNGNILSCTSGLTLLNGQCVSFTNNCGSYNQFGSCQQCSPNYDLDQNNNCLLQANATIACQIQSQGLCIKANNNFVLIGGAAYYAKNNIGQVNANGVIISSSAGYFIWTANNIAWPYDINCVSQVEPGKCVQCSALYTLFNGKCIIQRANCNAYSYYGLCTSCISGFFLWGGSCQINNCQNNALTPNGYCVSCPSTYNLQRGLCLFTLQRNCFVYSNTGACLYCNTNYYLTQNNVCAGMISNCLSANSQTGRCTQCILNYVNYQEKCIVQILNCNVYSTDLSSCSQCASNYYLTNVNRACTLLGKFCVAMSDNGQCTQCTSGYSPFNQNGNILCIIPINQCFSYDSNSNCVKCNANYVLQFNRCKSVRCLNYSVPTSSCMSCISPFVQQPNTNFCIDPYCAQSISEVCYACIAGYYLTLNGICVINDPNCKSYQNGFCFQCIPGFSLVNNICIRNLTDYNGCANQEFPCTKCLLGYTLNTNNGYCYAINCGSYLPNRNCLSCINYYMFEPSNRFCILYTCKSQSCYLNNSAPPGFYTNGSGSLQILYCSSYNVTNGGCLSCNNYRYPNNGILYNLCYPYNCNTNTQLDCNSNCLAYYYNYVQYPGSCIAANCSIYSQTGSCLQCFSNSYTLINNTCVPIAIPPYCQTYNFTALQCTLCIDYYQLYNSNLNCRVSYCLVFAITTPPYTNCSKCLNGYFLTSNNTCRLAMCSVLQSNSLSICQTCQPGYSFINNTYCYAVNCLVFDFASMLCSQCVQFYTVVASLGICKANNCLKYDSNFNCLTCQSGYTSQNGYCNFTLPPDPYCQTYDPQNNNLCLKCLPNFRYNTQSFQCESIYCLVFNPTAQTNARVCSQCLNLMKPDSSGRYCVPIYCQSYSIQTGFCLSCIPGFTYLNGYCYSNNCVSQSITTNQYPTCLQCSPGYNLIGQDGICYTNNCQNYDNSYACIQCNLGYTLNNFLCKTLTCNAGFQLVNGVCQSINCLNFNSTTNICQTCLPGFVQQGVSCIADSCISFNNLYACLKCLPGYNLIQSSNGTYLCALNFTAVCPSGYYSNGSSCVKSQINNCSIISPTNSSICLKCLPNYLLYNNLCYYLQNCLYYSYISGCLDCLPGFYLNGFLCQSYNCLVAYTNSTCQSCPQGYVLNNTYCSKILYKCNQQDLYGNCVNCANGFLLFGNSTCIANNCTQYNVNTFICSQCASGYDLIGQICQKSLTLPNCLIVTNATYCQQCLSSFINYQGICVIQVIGCLTYNLNTGQCSSCTTQYYLNYNFICVQLASNCISADLNGNCLQCAPSYLKFNSQCYVTINGCISYSSANGFCLTCDSPYYLTSSNTCNTLPSNCRNASLNGQCLTCSSNYVLQNGICVISISNCQSYNINTNLCVSCFPQYFLSSANSCVLLPQFCVVASPSGICLNCISGYQLFSNQCVFSIANCVNYQNNACIQCSNGYLLSSSLSYYNNNNNAVCILQVDNCNTYNLQSNLCLACLSGYNLNTNTNICQLTTPFCLNYRNNVCVSCINGYYLDNSNNCNQLPKNCSQVNSQGQCLACLSGYFLYQNIICIQFLNNCLTYNPSTYNCLICNSTFYLNNAFTCTILPNFCQFANPTGICLTCLQGYQLLSNNICQISIANCQNYQNNGCLSCNNGYTLLSNGNCVQIINNCLTYNLNSNLCLTCSNGYILSTNAALCYTIIPNCQIYNSNNNYLCSVCNNGFVILSNGYCVQQVSNCQTYNVNTLQCLTCVAGYSLNSQFQCLQNQIANCISYVALGCSACTQYYYLLNFNCYAFPSNCISYDPSQNRCLTCVSSFVLNINFQCVNQNNIANCMSYNSQGLCMNCNLRYYLSKNACFAYPAFCANVDLLGNCISCQFGYNLTSTGLCTANSYLSLNCLVFDHLRTNSCQSCQNGYSFCSNNNGCTLPDPNCLVLSSDGQTCISCIKSYNLFNGKCLPYPTGVQVLSNGATSCLSGYVSQGQSCVRSVNTLTRLSSVSATNKFQYSSNSQNNNPWIDSSTFWSPQKNALNQYISIVNTLNRPQIIFQVGIKGNSNGWVTAYVIQFKNRIDTPFICWNSCNKVSGNLDGINTSILILPYPIIATELRIYPVSWSQSITMQVELWTLVPQ